MVLKALDWRNSNPIDGAKQPTDNSRAQIWAVGAPPDYTKLHSTRALHGLKGTFNISKKKPECITSLVPSPGPEATVHCVLDQETAIIRTSCIMVDIHPFPGYYTSWQKTDGRGLGFGEGISFPQACLPQSRAEEQIPIRPRLSHPWLPRPQPNRYSLWHPHDWHSRGF